MKEKQTNNKLNNKMIIAGVLLILAVIIVCMILFFNKEEYTINFETNGGTPVASIIIDKDGIAEKPEDPVKEGYIFAGWYYNDEPFDFSKPITSDMELEARWVVDADAEDVEDKDDLEDDDTEKEEDNKDNEKVEDNKENNKVEDNKENNKVEDNKDEQPKEDPKEDDKEEDKEDEKIAVTGVSLDKTSLTLTEGESSKLTATVKPSNATNKNVKWSSNNTAVATVDSNGNVKAIAAGTATITVTTTDGNYTSTCTVTVNEKPASYTVTLTAIEQPLMGTLQYYVTVYKNGSSFSEWEVVKFDSGARAYPGGTISSIEYKEITSATVKLKDGNSFPATVNK